jgi:hypothetical protein
MILELLMELKDMKSRLIVWECTMDIVIGHLNTPSTHGTQLH